MLLRTKEFLDISNWPLHVTHLNSMCRGERQWKLILDLALVVKVGNNCLIGTMNSCIKLCIISVKSHNDNFNWEVSIYLIQISACCTAEVDPRSTLPRQTDTPLNRVNRYISIKIAVVLFSIKYIQGWSETLTFLLYRLFALWSMGTRVRIEQ